MTDKEFQEALANAWLAGARYGWDQSGEGFNAEYLNDVQFELGVRAVNPYTGEVEFIDGADRQRA